MGDNSGLVLQMQGWASWAGAGRLGRIIANARLPACIHVYSSRVMLFFVVLIPRPYHF